MARYVVYLPSITYGSALKCVNDNFSVKEVTGQINKESVMMRSDDIIKRISSMT